MSSVFFKRRLSGRDYRIKVFRFAKRCQITLQDIITSSTWKGNFDMTCIETMTRKTGRFMPFEMFFSLLLANLRHATEAQLSLMTFGDLQNLFREEVSSAIARQMDEENRRYLILTVGQPMITHYPLPLLFCEEADPELMAITRQQLQGNIAVTAGHRSTAGSPRSPAATRRISRKKERTREPERAQSRRISFGKGDFLERVMGEQIEKVLNDGFSPSPVRQETAGSLRMELREQARDFKRELARLRRENERLRRRLEEMRIREIDMTADMVRLTERQRLNVQARAERPTRARSSSPGRRLGRHRPGSASSVSLSSRSPRPVRSMFNFFETEDARSGRRPALERRLSSPAVRDVSASRGRLQSQMRSKSLDDARAERYVCSPGRRCCHRGRGQARADRQSAVEPDSADWRPFGAAARTAPTWAPFDPTQYVAERREALRQRSLERQLMRERAPRPPVRPRRRSARRSAPPADRPPPTEEHWQQVGDSAVVGMRQLEMRLKNLQRMLSDNLT